MVEVAGRLTPSLSCGPDYSFDSNFLELSRDAFMDFSILVLRAIALGAYESLASYLVSKSLDGVGVTSMAEVLAFAV
jgi:hypothetical protein